MNEDEGKQLQIGKNLHSSYLTCWEDTDLLNHIWEVVLVASCEILTFLILDHLFSSTFHQNTSTMYTFKLLLPILYCHGRSLWELLSTFISTFIDGTDSNLILLPRCIIPSSDLPQEYHYYILKPNCIKSVPPEVLLIPFAETLTLYSPILYFQSPVNSLQQISRIWPSCTSSPHIIS